MYNEDSELVAIDCIFTNNRTSPGNGGGMTNIGSSVEIAGCKFTLNQADFYGGGMANVTSTLKISDSVFSENKAIRFHGGAIVNWDASLTISNSQFSENIAKSGNGIFNHNSSQIIEKSVFSGDKKSAVIKDEGENSKTILNDCEITSGDIN
jgi:hypothetical protein